jgi:asparagine synthase (glutamine-hydrolysing)
VLLTNGISRGLARLAFADRLPPSIAKRTTKGSTLKFWHHVLREHTAFLRESLLDGLLVKEGLLDKGKLDAYLVEDQPFLTVHPGQIVVYLGVEAWLRQAAALRQRAAA